MDTFFKNLTDAIKNHNQIVLMAHKNIDLDAFGSCLCFYKIVETFHKKCSIILNKEVNDSVKKTLRKIKENHQEFEYISENQALKLKSKNTLLIILDTHKEELVESPLLLSSIEDKIIIDHHIKSKNYIKDTLITYINSAISSTAEILVSYLKYLNKTVDSLTATIMLAGMEIDTNSFNLKTTPSTYEAAAFLSEIGADNLVKKELLQENKEEYLKRQDLIKNAYMLTKNMAICILDANIYKKEELARIATELLQFEDVEAGFAIGKLSNSIIGISAKSLGNLDVEAIMKQFGGGGHMNNAAAQIENTTISEVKNKLKDLVNQE